METKYVDPKLEQETMLKLKRVLGESFMAISRETGYSTDELIETLTSVNLRKLHDSVEEAVRMISEAIDLNTDEIYRIMSEKRQTDLDDLAKRLHEKSRIDRGRLSSV